MTPPREHPEPNPATDRGTTTTRRLSTDGAPTRDAVENGAAGWASASGAGAAQRQLAHRVGELERALFDLEQRSSQHAALVDQLAVDLDQVDSWLLAHDGAAAAATANRTEPDIDPTPSAVVLPPAEEFDDWVTRCVLPYITVPTGRRRIDPRWCGQWWRHQEAVARFTALYLAYAELSTQDSATWFSDYLRDHLDPHLARLTSPTGPFRVCRPRRHRALLPDAVTANRARGSPQGGASAAAPEPSARRASPAAG
jgi:hypothetical protein